MRTKDKEYCQLQQLTKVAQNKLSDVTIEVVTMQTQLKSAGEVIEKHKMDIIKKEEEKEYLNNHLQMKTVALKKAEMNAQEIKDELEK